MQEIARRAAMSATSKSFITMIWRSVLPPEMESRAPNASAP